MGSLIAHFRRVVDTELEGLQVRAGNTGFRIALLVVAGIVVLLGLLALEGSAFLALETLVSPPVAALLTAVGTFVLAGIVALVANASTGKTRLHEIALRKDLARREMRQDIERMMSVATMTTGALATLKKLRPTPSPTPPVVVPQTGATVVVRPGSSPPAVWRGTKRNGIIAAVAAAGFAVGVSPALRRSMKRLIS